MSTPFRTALELKAEQDAGRSLAAGPAGVTDLAVPADIQLAVDASSGSVTVAQVRVLKATICAKLSIEQLQLYLAICHRKGIDPFTQAYAFPGQDGGLSFGLRIDGMRALAMKTGQYVSREVKTIFDKDGKVLGAVCTVKRTGMEAPVVEEAWLSEYDQSGAPKFNLWKTHSETMIRKVAESKALRAAFPDALAGLYEPSEVE